MLSKSIYRAISIAIDICTLYLYFAVVTMDQVASDLNLHFD